MASEKRELVAVIGTACRFPGKVSNLDEYWQFLKRGGDAVQEIPESRWDWRFHYDQELDKTGKAFVNRGAFMDWDIASFDAAFFDISPREAAILDPQQRLLLEVTFEALEDAVGDVTKLRGSDTGVYMGCFMQDNLITQMGSGGAKSQLGTYTAVSSTMTMISNRLSYSFDLRGPSFTLDTACSSSLVALHQACRGLLAGDCNLAVTGGVNVMFRPEIMMMMSKGRFLAQDGRSKTFSANADGYGRGEGSGVVVLKRYSDALRDGDTIHGVIHASGTNQDGNSDGITVPNEVSQRALVRHVYQEAGIKPDDISYLEAHGTGTPVGDPIEMRAMGTAICGERSRENHPLVVGSVKAGMGHLEAAAGIAGFLKGLLIAKHGQITPQAWLDTELNPAIDFDGLHIRIADKYQELPQSANGNAYVAVNSFGYGGANAHAVVAGPVEEVSSERFSAPEAPANPAAGFLLNISAASDAACAAYGETYLQQLENASEAEARRLCRDVMRKSQLIYRWSIRAATVAELRENLAAAIEDSQNENVTKSRAHKMQQPVFVFSGMGPQWWGMGQQLMKTEPVFANALTRADKIFQKISGWSILEEMQRPEESSRILETEIAQPANFMIQMGLFELFKSWGVKPAAVLGHSVGEVSSGYASGSLSLEDALLVSFHRSRTQAKTAGTGSMVATAMGQAEAEKFLLELEKRIDPVKIGSVSIAGINSISNTTLSGDEAIIDQIVTELESAGIFARKLRVEVPYHSAGMDPILEELEDSLEALEPTDPQIPLYSTVTGELAGAEGFDAHYWCDNVREPVYFQQAIDNLLDAGHELFVEIGPHPVLTGYIKETILKSSSKGNCINTLKREENESQRLEAAISALWTSGAQIDLSGYLGGEADQQALLPVYPWQRKIHWSETKYDQQARQGWPEAHHLLGRRLADPLPTWTSELSPTVLPWLTDHQVGGNVVFPGAGYVETLVELLAEASKDSDKVMRNIRFHRAMVLGAAEDMTLKTVYSDGNRASIYAGLGSKQDDWKLYSEADFINGCFTQPAGSPVDALSLETFETISVSDLYAKFSSMGLDYGPEFRSIKGIKRNNTTALVELETGDRSSYSIHPVLLDGAFQSMLALLDDDAAGTAFLPVKIAELRLYQKLPCKAQALLQITANNSRYIEADLTLIADGVVAAEVFGIRCDAVQLTSPTLETELESVSYHLGWHKVSDEREFEVRQNIAMIGDSFVAGLENSLDALGCANIFSFGSLEQFAQSESPDQFEQLIVFVNSDSDENAVSDAVEMTLAIQQVHAAGFTADIAMVTRDSLGAEVRASMENWHSAWVAGFRRCAHNELTAINMRQIDIDSDVDAYLLAAEICVPDPEDEVAIVGDEIWAMQIRRVNKSSYPELQANIKKPFSDTGQNNFSLKVPEQKTIKSLAFGKSGRIAPKANEIEVKVDTVSLNYKDFAKVAGLLTEELVANTNSKMTLGIEVEGVVARIGEDVDGYHVGDKVAIAGQDCFQRYITVSTDPRDFPFTHIKPQIENFAAGQTAASYVAYGTALWGLRDVAHLKQGETVLIHGATGGVGLAAVNVARMLGAKVIASAGSEEKRDYLRSIGVQHVVDSRSLNFGKQVQQITNGKGANVVFNSAAGGVIPVSLEAMASFGRFIEIGKGEIYARGKLDLALFEKGVTYSTLDFEYLLFNNLDYFSELMDSLFGSLNSGELPPLPVKLFPASKLNSAFKYLSKSKHIGKVCVDLNDTAMVSQYQVRPAQLNPEKCVIITGGLGGVGLLMADWCIDRGARRLVLIGRKGAATEEAKNAVAALESRGAEVVVHACDVASFDSMQKMMEQTRERWIVGGVIHAAGLLDDRGILEMDEEAVRKVAIPKVIGANILHELTKDDHNVDLFWAISSVAAVSGNSYQTNYALANTYMDGLMEARQAMQLPGNTIQLGPVDGIGMATVNEDLRKFLEMRGMHYMSPELLKASFDRVMQWNIPIMPMALLEWPVWEFAEPRAASSHRYAVIIGEEGAGNSGDSTLEAILQLPQEQRIETVGYMVIELVAEILQMNPDDVELDAPLDTFGIDSLTAVELQASLNRNLQVEVSILSMLGGKTIHDIATELAEMIGQNRSSDGQQNLDAVAG